VVDDREPIFEALEKTEDALDQLRAKGLAGDATDGG
jgi:hypothetical protein